MKLVCLLTVVLITCECRLIIHDFGMEDLGFLRKTNGHAEKMTTSNYKAANWVMGNIEDNQFKLNVFRTMASGSNIIKCQLDVPFWNG